MARQRTCILVLGMHRSGTSAITRLINLAGADLPEDLMEGKPDNATGHWESKSVVAFNDSLLGEFASRWDDWAPVDLSRLTQAERGNVTARIGAMVDTVFGQARLFAIKDPRICRIADLYLDALAQRQIDVRVVIPIRNPLEVAASLMRRNGLAKTYATVLWLRHVIDAEFASRSCQRVIFSYDGLLQDWRGTLAGLLAGVPGISPRCVEDVAPEAEAFLRTDLRHHAFGIDDLRADADLPAIVTSAYEAMLALAGQRDAAGARACLDGVRRVMAGLTGARMPQIALKDGCRDLVALRAQNTELTGMVDGLKSLVREMAEVQRLNAALKSEVAWRRHRLEKFRTNPLRGGLKIIGWGLLIFGARAIPTRATRRWAARRDDLLWSKR